MRRALDTQDGQDFVLQAEVDFDLVWAFNESNSSISAYHERRGATSYRIAAPVVVIKPEPTVTDEESKETSEEEEEVKPDKSDTTVKDDTSIAGFWGADDGAKILSSSYT